MEHGKLKEILERHQHWISEDCDGWFGMKADLRGANLRDANLRDVNLYGANLCGANLRGANLHGANLRDVNLYGADLCGADLYGANLHGANLRGVNLYGANLCGADLYGADLRDANLCGADLYGADLRDANLCGADLDTALLNKFFPICCPEYGAFIGWKKCGNYIVKLRITDDAKRSSAFGRKCRCSKAEVLAIETIDGEETDLSEAASGYDHDFIYRVGETVEVTDFDEDRKKECAPGIHFFITRQEAVDYY